MVVGEISIRFHITNIWKEKRTQMFFCRKMLDCIIGDPRSFNIEHRIYHMFTLSGVLLCISACIVNNYLHLNVIMKFFPFLFGILGIILYYFSRIKHLFMVSAVIMVNLLIFVLYPVTWINNGGSLGGSQYYLIIIVMMIATVFSGKKRVIFFGCLLLIMAFLFVFEYCFPHLIRYYSCPKERLLDVYFGLFLASVTSFIYLYFKELSCRTQ